MTNALAYSTAVKGFIALALDVTNDSVGSHCDIQHNDTRHNDTWPNNEKCNIQRNNF
jgi:hypothetical protein